jgi:hypothetical protein
VIDAPIRAKDREAIIQSLRAGVVPRRGQHHIQVGRKEEIEALIGDIATVADGGSTIRFVIGEYGSGKTFFLSLMATVALEKGLVVTNADLNPDRRLHASGGQARSLYAELMRNLATRTKPEGGALSSVVEKFISSALLEGKDTGAGPEQVIHRRLESLAELVGGYDFANVVAAYWRGHDEGTEQLKVDAVRWLRGEFTTKTDARTALGVRVIVDDSNFYDQLKLMARFVRLAGFRGLLVSLDEMVNLYKLGSGRARASNYEQILRILNDSLQGNSVGLGFLMGGTPEFLMDTRRGLYSYEALESRLAENQFAAPGFKDYSGPVIRLANLTQEELYLLLTRLRHVYAGGDESKYLLPDDALTGFMQLCGQRIGEAYFRTPRNTVKSFVELLAILDQNPGVTWQQVLQGIDIEKDEESDIGWLPDDEDDLETGGGGLTTFRL